MKIELIGNEEKYALEQSLLTLLPAERPVYGEVDRASDSRWAVVSLREDGAEVAVTKLQELRGCRAHCTAILSDRDEQAMRALGIDVTSEPEYVTTNLYYN